MATTSMMTEEHTKPTSLAFRLREVAVAVAPLGFIAFGGPAAHIGILEQQFVEKLRWIDTERFVELMSIGQGLPGPSSTQMVVAIGAMRCGVPGGLLAFFLWNLPGFIVLTTVALLAVSELDGGLPDYLIGLPAAATSLVFVAAYNLGVSVCSDKTRSVQQLKTGLAVMTTMTTLLVTGDAGISPRWAGLAFPVLLIGSGLCTLADSRRAGREALYWTAPNEEEAAVNERLRRTMGISKRMGVALFVSLAALLGAMIGLRGAGVLAPAGLGELFEAMMRTAMFVFGGGQVIVPLLLTETVETGWLTDSQFLIGFGLMQSLPGPIFNFSAYLGGVHLGFAGAVVAWAGLFGPGIMLIFAFLPFWMSLRRVAWFKSFLAGVNAAAIGLVVAACAQLWEKAVFSWATAGCFFLTGSLVKLYDVFVPLAILAGGLLGFLMSPTVAGFAQGFN